jgi:hypothetical protein
MAQFIGGCVCGAVRFALDRPLWVVVCHCDACKKRTGSAFGISLVMDSGGVRDFTGETRSFVRTGESGRKVRYEFCPGCGTTLRWHVELISSRQVFAGGTLDDPTKFDVGGEMYTGEALPWARLECELYREGAPDDEFRRAMIEKAGPGRSTHFRSATPAPAS